MYVVVLAAALCPAAPAPLPRPRPPQVKELVPADLRGAWLLEWGESKWDMTLSASGEYECVLRPQAPGEAPVRWAGWWELMRGGTELVVQDAQLYPGEDLAVIATTQPHRLRIWRVPFERLPHGRFDRHNLAGQGAYDGTAAVKVRMVR